MTSHLASDARFPPPASHPTHAFHLPPPRTAVIANRNLSMYGYLTRTIERQLQADPSLVTQVGMFTHLYSYALSPLGLAAQLGDHGMVRHMLQMQCETDWVWGRVTQFSLDLNGIDSSGAGGGDVMELIARIGARKGTTSLLLDSFMNGFINDLFLSKWRMFGRVLLTAQLLPDALLAVSLAIQTLALKETPERLTDGDGRITGLSIANLCLIALRLEEEARVAFLYCRNEQAGTPRADGTRIAPRRMLRMLASFMWVHGVHISLLAYLFATMGAIVLLNPATFLPARAALHSTPGSEWFVRSAAAAARARR